MNKRFWVVDIEHSVIEMELNSPTPRDAALKAATRDIQRIYLAEVDSGKLHIFSGRKVDLTEHEENEFTKKRNITSKPVVSKQGYLNLKTALRKADLPAVIGEFSRIVS